MAYTELIKNFERVREYMRQFYLYGFKSREEYSVKSARSYDDDRRRIETWLGEYMGFKSGANGKNVFISIDSRAVKSNPLFKAWKTCSFTDKDITLHFILLDILKNHPCGITTRDICDKVQYCMSYNEVANTNLQNVFRLILNTAVKNHLPQEQLPAKLYIISDMEFDHCVADAGVTNFEWAKREFARHGYTLPQVIFWNVDSRNNQQPVTQHENGVALVSGASPRIFKMLTSDNLNPYAFMMEAIGSERYAKIAA